jgi:pimeloyl-ACP methyl ester carboxylesterase
VNGWWLAELSLLEYVREPAFKSAVLERAGLSGGRYFDVRATNTQCLVAQGDAAVLVVFRGTELGSLRDLLTDAAVVWRREPGGGRIHQGFSDALDSLWPQLRAYLDEVGQGRAIWLAGHSLGGALATLAAHRLGDAATGLVTFGCPRVGNEEFAGRFACPAWRVVNNNDLVARIPPWPYVAVGALCYLDRNGRLHLDADERLRRDDRWQGHLQHARGVMARWADGDFDVVFNDDLYDHAPIHYVRWLRRLAFAAAG